MYIQNCAEEKKFSARMMCAVLPVSESGFYNMEAEQRKAESMAEVARSNA